jgi:hypothetical protein
MTTFSARLDETGTDGRSPYAIVAGGVSVPEFWKEVENKYSRLLASKGVSAFHWKEWMDRDGDFKGWSELKRKRFIRAKEKIFEKSIVFTIAVAVHRETHGSVKKRMVGIRRFKPDSDCGICFRYARFRICQKLTELFKQGEIRTAPQVQFIVEAGPYAADAHAIYQEIVRSAGSRYRPAMYADMLAGFASVPKGQLKSLEVADYISGRALLDLDTIGLGHRKGQISMVMRPEFLEQWYRDMMEVRAQQQAYGTAKRAASSGRR